MYAELASVAQLTGRNVTILITFTGGAELGCQRVSIPCSILVWKLVLHSHQFQQPFANSTNHLPWRMCWMCGTTGRMAVGISTTAGLRSLTKAVLVCPTFIMSLVRRKDQTLAIALHTEVCL